LRGIRRSTSAQTGLKKLILGWEIVGWMEVLSKEVDSSCEAPYPIPTSTVIWDGEVDE
jgi:hypothetical protein